MISCESIKQNFSSDYSSKLHVEFSSVFMFPKICLTNALFFRFQSLAETFPWMPRCQLQQMFKLTKVNIYYQ